MYTWCKQSFAKFALLHWIGSISYLANKKREANASLFYLVELRGIEPLSESNLERTSPGAVCYLHSLNRTGTNTLTESVAS